MGTRNSVARKPVPQMIVSAGCSRPSAVTTAVGRIPVIGSVTTSTEGRSSAG
ncbi:hypothetical protein ACI797_03525 [Geodermatophilus sp. SYSU D00691]